MMMHFLFLTLTILSFNFSYADANFNTVVLQESKKDIEVVQVPFKVSFLSESSPIEGPGVYQITYFVTQQKSDELSFARLLINGTMIDSDLNLYFSNETMTCMRYFSTFYTYTDIREIIIEINSSDKTHINDISICMTKFNQD